jgi:hypothetical protein
VRVLSDYLYLKQELELLGLFGVRHDVFLDDAVRTTGLISPPWGLPKRSPNFSRQISWLMGGA